MTSFERFLIDKGYIKFILVVGHNASIMKYQQTEKHEISTMTDIDHRYFHNTDVNVLEAIKTGKSVMDKSFPDRSKEIIFGLSERNKPPTLIYPRPIITIKKIIDGKCFLFDQRWDDSINIVLEKIPFSEILKAMFDKSIKFDLTK